MVVKFGKEYLRELFEEGKCSDKHHRYQPQVVRKYVLRVAIQETIFAYVEMMPGILKP